MVLEALLHKGPLTISEIQAKVLLASGSTTAAVDRVESMGLVVRKTTAKDRRARVLELTPKGRDYSKSHGWEDEDVIALGNRNLVPAVDDFCRFCRSSAWAGTR